MRITHLGHAAVLVETDDARVLIDPGNFSTGWHGLTDLDAILVTHQHPDQLRPGARPGTGRGQPWRTRPGRAVDRCEDQLRRPARAG